MRLPGGEVPAEWSRGTKKARSFERAPLTLQRSLAMSAAPGVTATTGMASAREPGCVFPASVMAWIAGMAMLINRRVSVEMVER
jgi:hypothetical protein